MKKNSKENGSVTLISVLLVGLLSSLILGSNMDKTLSKQNTSIIMRDSALSTVAVRNTQESLLTLLRTANNRNKFAKELTPQECKIGKEPSLNDEMLLNGLLKAPEGVKIYGNIHQVNCGTPSNNDFRLRYRIVANLNCDTVNSSDCVTSSVSGWYLNDAGQNNYGLKLCTAGNTTQAIDNNAVFAESTWRSQLTVGGDIIASPSGKGSPYKIQADWGENKQFQPTMPSLANFTPITVGGRIGNPSNKPGTDFIISTTGAQFDGLNNTVDLNGIIAKTDPNWATSRFWKSIWDTSAVDTSNMVDKKLAAIATRKDAFLKNYIGLTNQEAVNYTNQTVTLPPGASKNIPGESKIVSLLDMAEAQSKFSPGTPGAVSLMHIKPAARPQSDLQTGRSYYLALGLGKNKKNLTQWEAMKATNQHWITDRWNDIPKCKQAGVTSCPNIADQNQGVADNTVVIIDGNVKLQDIQYPSAATIIVLGNVIVEGEVILHSNLIVQGNLFLRGDLIFGPRFWFGKTSGDPSCKTELVGSKATVIQPSEGVANGHGSLTSPASTSIPGANGAKSS